MRTPTAAPTTTAPQSKAAAPWEGCPTSTLAPPTATAHMKATAHACPNDRCCQSALANRNAKATHGDGAGERGKHAEGRGRNDDCGQGHGDRPASEHDGGTCLRRRRGGALPAGSGLRVVFPLLAHGDNGIMAASGKEPHRRSGIHSLPWRQAPAGTVPARTKASTFLASTAAARPVFGYHTYGRKSWLEEAAR